MNLGHVPCSFRVHIHLTIIFKLEYICNIIFKLYIINYIFENYRKFTDWKVQIRKF